MGDDYDFDFKFDSNKVKDWAKDKKKYDSDSASGSFDEFLDDSDLEDSEEKPLSNFKTRARDGGNSPTFSDDSPDGGGGGYKASGLELQIGQRPDYGDDMMDDSSEHMGMDSKKKLSSSRSGLLQTQHDLEKIRWSQDSAVKQAMAEAEKAEASSIGGTMMRNSYSSGGALRTSTQSWNQNQGLRSDALREEEEDLFDESQTNEGNMSSIASALSTPVSFVKKQTPVSTRSRIMSSADYSDDYDDDDENYEEDDDFVSESPVMKAAGTSGMNQPPPPMSLNKESRDSYSNEDEYSDDDESEDNDNLNKVTTFASSLPLLPPPMPTSALNNPPLSKAVMTSSTAGTLPVTVVAKFLRLGKREFEAWEEDEEDGCVEKSDFVMFFSEYKDTFELPLKVLSCVKYMKSINRLHYESLEELKGDELYNLLFESIYNDSNGKVTPKAVENFFLKTVQSVYGGEAVVSPTDNNITANTTQTQHVQPSSFTPSPESTASSTHSPMTAPPDVISYPGGGSNTNEIQKGFIASLPPSLDLDGDSSIKVKKEEEEMDNKTANALNNNKMTEELSSQDGDGVNASNNKDPQVVSRQGKDTELVQPLQAPSFSPSTSLQGHHVTAASNPPVPLLVGSLREEAWKEGFLAAQAQSNMWQSQSMASLQSTNQAAQSPLIPTTSPTSPPPVVVPNELIPHYKEGGGTGPSSRKTFIPLSELTLDQTSDLLWSIGFGAHYAQALHNNEVDGSLLSLVEAQEELGDIGVNIAIKRKKLLQYILCFKERGVPKSLLSIGAKNKNKNQEDCAKAERMKVNNPGTGIGYRPGEHYEFGGRSASAVSGLITKDDKMSSQKQDDDQNDIKVTEGVNVQSSPEQERLSSHEKVSTSTKPSSLPTRQVPTAWSDCSDSETADNKTSKQAHNGAPKFDGHNDPTLPMARVYLKLLAESQQEAALLKQRVFDLSNEVILLKSMLNDKKKVSKSSEDGESNSDPVSSNINNENENSSMNHSNINNPEISNHFKADAMNSSSFMNTYNIAKDELMRKSLPQSSMVGSGTSNGEALALQHAARQAQLRQQYDMLRSQLAASRKNADTYGRFASLGHYTRLTDVQKELGSKGPVPLKFDEALKRVDDMFSRTS